MVVYPFFEFLTLLGTIWFIVTAISAFSMSDKEYKKEFYGYDSDKGISEIKKEKEKPIRIEKGSEIARKLEEKEEGKEDEIFFGSRK